jgi:hypothetical protein
MTRGRCWGVYRELAHSPGRETDDAEILRATARELEARGFDVELKSPDELSADVETSGFGGGGELSSRGVTSGYGTAGEAVPNLFVMCERIPIVERLSTWERRGARIVNRPSGIRNTDRERTIALFRRHEVSFPDSVLVGTRSGDASFRGACWVKRADVHATEAGDVSFAGSAEELETNLERLRGRGIARAVVQEHVPGDLIKFYGVAGLADDDDRPSWFQWFYHRDQKLSNHSFDRDALALATSRAAAALGLEVYGGDAIVAAGGAISVIDLNAWPSFALFRPVAAAKIAALLAERFSRARTTIRTPTGALTMTGESE